MTKATRKAPVGQGPGGSEPIEKPIGPPNELGWDDLVPPPAELARIDEIRSSERWVLLAIGFICGAGAAVVLFAAARVCGS